jgi:hypothetical protein
MRRLLVLALSASASLAILACNDDNNDSGTGQPGQGSQPASEVLNISPTPGTMTATVGTPIIITFDGTMDTTAAHYVDLHLGTIDGPVVPMDCTWRNAVSTLACAVSTAQPLLPDSLYTLHMGAGLMASNGSVIGTMGMADMGGTDVMMTGSMMHGGQPASALGDGWRGTGNRAGSIGFAFPMHFLPLGGTGT